MDDDVFQNIRQDSQDPGCQDRTDQDQAFQDSAGADKASGNNGHFNHLPSAKAKRALDMRVEHRHTLALDTEIHFQDQQVAGMIRCTTSNIGLSGAFLPSKHIPLHGKSEVEVIFRAPTQPTQKQHRLSAKVVRTSSKGAALAFFLADDGQLQDFRRFLLQAKIAARH